MNYDLNNAFVQHFTPSSGTMQRSIELLRVAGKNIVLGFNAENSPNTSSL